MLRILMAAFLFFALAALSQADEIADELARLSARIDRIETKYAGLSQKIDTLIAQNIAREAQVSNQAWQAQTPVSNAWGTPTQAVPVQYMQMNYGSSSGRRGIFGGRLRGGSCGGGS